jgi:hypothetical protein
MKASKFTEAQIAFVLKQAEDGTPIGEVCRKAGKFQFRVTQTRVASHKNPRLSRKLKGNRVSVQIRCTASFSWLSN